MLSESFFDHHPLNQPKAIFLCLKIDLGKVSKFGGKTNKSGVIKDILGGEGINLPDWVKGYNRHQ